MAEEWFRRKTWTPADREAFFDRLRRSRTTFHKAQYLRIQAVELQEVGSQAGVSAALELAEVLLRDYPEPSELAQAHLIRAECLEPRGDVAGAVEAYHSALQAQRAQPKVSTTAHLAFAWMVATRPLPEQYREALAALDEFGERDGFLPASRYRSSGARALILSALGDRASARQAARLALEAAAADHSGLRYHPRVGLVRASDRGVNARLGEIAAAEPGVTPDRGGVR
jgi:tetratricopeptide (TPR) repeat protein